MSVQFHLLESSLICLTAQKYTYFGQEDNDLATVNGH